MRLVRARLFHAKNEAPEEEAAKVGQDSQATQDTQVK